MAEDGKSDDKPLPPLPPIASKAKDLEALRNAVVDAANVSAGFWFSYLFVLLYFIIAVGSVTHRNLFFETPIKLPILNVDLPLIGFFVLGPGLFIIVHAYILLHFAMFADKVGAFHAELQTQIVDEDVRARLRRQLPSNIFVQFLAGPREVRTGLMGVMLRLIALISLVIGPIALLVFFQLQFLPYHNEPILWWQRIAVVLDLALLWVLWPSVARGETSSMVWRDFKRPGVIAAAALSALPVLLVFTVATFPGEWLHRNPAKLPIIPEYANESIDWITPHKFLVAGDIDLVARKQTSVWSNRLVLPNLEQPPVNFSARGRQLEGAVLLSATLQKVDFSAAQLRNAIFNEADLKDAKFLCAEGKMRFEDYGSFAEESERQCTQLQHAWFSSAKLQGASFERAQLDRAWFQNANLQNVSFDYAQLPGAWFYDANLAGASFRGAHAQGATFNGAKMPGLNLAGAELQGATFDSAHLEGARLDGASLHGARLNGAKLKGASFLNATLLGASLERAEIQGGQFHNAELYGATLAGAELQGANFNQSFMRGASFAKAQLHGASFVGARLEGAFFDEAQLQGASFQGAFLLGASFDKAALHGVTFERAEVQNARFQNVFAWRADVRNVQAAANTRVTAPESAPVYDAESYGYSSPLTCPADKKPCDWSPASFSAVRRLIEDNVTEASARKYALEKIVSLDPGAPLEGERDMDPAWQALGASSPAAEDFNKGVVSALTRTGCNQRGAPYVTRGIVRDLGARFATGDAQLVALATAFLDEGCLGAREPNEQGPRVLTEEDKAKLVALRDTLPPPPPADPAPRRRRR